MKTVASVKQVGEIQQSVVEKIRKLHSKTIWGGNATSPRDVLVFSEQYLCGDKATDEEKEAICQFLLDNKFSLSVKNGKWYREWAMPANPVAEPFITLRKECEESFETAMTMYQEKAEAELEAYDKSDARIMVFKTDNKLYRQCIRQVIASTTKYVTTMTSSGDWVYAVKYGEPYGDMRKIEADHRRILDFFIENFMESVEYAKKFNALMKGMPAFNKNMIVGCEPRFVFYVSMAVVNEFMNKIKNHGFGATLFPVHDLESYTSLGIRTFDSVSVYLEPKV